MPTFSGAGTTSSPDVLAFAATVISVQTHTILPHGVAGCHTGLYVGGGNSDPSTGHSLGGSEGLPPPPENLHPLRLILMTVAVEGPELSSVPFKEIL